MKDWNMFYQPPCEIREQKATCYTIRLIGGPEEYKQYLKEKEEKLLIKKQAQCEAYQARRIFLEGIVLGEEKASIEALTPAPTLFRARWELSGRPRDIPAVTHINEPISDAQAPTPIASWVQKAISFFKIKL